MANICECAVAIAKEDLAKLDGAITKTEEGEGIEEEFTYDIISKDDRHSVRRYNKHIWERGKTNQIEYYEVDGEKLDEDTYDKKYPRDKWICDYQTHKCTIDKVFSNGWCVNWRLLKAYSYEIPPYVAEYDDHITIYFGGRWSFPESLKEFLNSKEVRWQGAEAECGCELLNSELGNEDFGLMCYVDKDDEGFDNYYVEDRTKNTPEMSFEEKYRIYAEMRDYYAGEDIKSIAEERGVKIKEGDLHWLIEKYKECADMTLAERDLIENLVDNYAEKGKES